MFFGGGYPQSECCLFSSFLDVVFMHPSVNIYFIYLGHANGYTNGRMRNPRRERRERQGDVSSFVSCSCAVAVMQTLTSRGRYRATGFSVCVEKIAKKIRVLKVWFPCREVSLSLCKSCLSSSWLLCQPSAKSWSTAHRTAWASGRKSPLPCTEAWVDERTHFLCTPIAVKYANRPHPPIPLFFFNPGQQVTRRRGWLKTWRCRIMWGSSSPKSSAAGF